MNEFFTEGTSWVEADMEMRTLDGPPPAGFDCAAEAQNEFLYERAWRDTCRSVSVTHTLYIKGILAGYVTLMGDRIKLGPRERAKGISYQFVPALKVAQLGVDTRFSGRGLGKYLVGYSVQTALQWRGRDRVPVPDAGFAAGTGRVVRGAGIQAEPGRTALL